MIWQDVIKNYVTPARKKSNLIYLIAGLRSYMPSLCCDFLHLSICILNGGLHGTSGHLNANQLIKRLFVGNVVFFYVLFAAQLDKLPVIIKTVCFTILAANKKIAFFSKCDNIHLFMDLSCISKIKK